MSVHNEEWEWHPRAGGGARLYSSGHEEEWATTWGDENHVRAKLAAQAPAMARLLIEVLNRVNDPLADKISNVLHDAGVIEVHKFKMTL